MKEQIKTPGKEPSDKKIENLSDAQFKTLIIRMFTEIVEYGHKMKEEIKAIQKESKEKYTGKQQRKEETGTQISDLNKRKK